MNKMMLDGTLTLTVCEGHTTALLTTRGKDHDLTIDGLNELIDSLYQARTMLQKHRIECELPVLMGILKPKMQEYLEPCDELRIDIEPSEDDVLILIPVNHPYDEAVERMANFEVWWLEHEYDHPVPFNVVIDLDYRE